MKDISIFYSWQSDHRQTKNFIDKALSDAIKELAGSNTLDMAPRLDKDTQGTAGSPNIVNTILGKIDECGVFVADISIVDESKGGRKLVNQNVMFELGYAVAKRSEVNTMMLFNSDLGSPKDLPFDISHHRVLQFSVKNDDKSGTKLKAKLVGALTTHLSSLDRQEVMQVEKALDDIQLLIMKVFASMTDDRRILVSSTLGGQNLHLMSVADESLSRQLDSMNADEVIANLNELVDLGILALSYGSKGTPNYKLAKRGFEIVNVLNGKQANKVL